MSVFSENNLYLSKKNDQNSSKNPIKSTIYKKIKCVDNIDLFKKKRL